MQIPDALPVLSVGHHPWGSGQACVMDAVSWLSGHEEWGDAPECVHPVLRAIAIRANDGMPDSERHKLWTLVPKLIGTNPDLPELESKRLSVRLAVFAVRQVQHLVREQDREVCDKALEAAEAWCDEPSEARADAATVAADAATVAAAGADTFAATNAAIAAGIAGKAAATSSADTVVATVYAAGATAAAGAGLRACFALLSDLVDEYRRLMPTQEREVTDGEWTELRECLGVGV